MLTRLALLVSLPACTTVAPMPSESQLELCRREVVALHEFFEDWFTGRLQASDDVFQRFALALDIEFEIVGPGGVAIGRPDLLASLRAAHGAYAETFRIWIENLEARALSDDLVLVTYEEWQQDAGSPRARRSSAVMQCDPEASGGVRWLHVHETWIND